jgi:radical SAM superfamily enzyme YgiQ (UPF0313 family)
MRKRRALLVYPRFARAHLLNYQYMAPFFPGKVAVMPPTGLLLVGGLFLDADWDVKLIDEHVHVVTPEDYDWADVVCVSGMHQQRARMCAILDEGNKRGKITVVGGSSVSICPEYYPMADVLHLGELGDETHAMLEFLRDAGEKPVAQKVFHSKKPMPLDEQPMPALDLVDVNQYLLHALQFSVGCPYTCEFCDIPMIYGRVARLKSPARVTRELDALYARGFIGSVMFADDNLIANRKALREFLPELAKWQKAHDFPFPLSGEASVNLARDKEILELLRQARFTHMFIGVESPDEETLVEISKKQNVMDPVLESLRAIEEAGIEVLIGIIFGFDTDTPETGERVRKFIDQAYAPIIHFNMLAALPKTPLWERMTREGRLIDNEFDELENLLGCLNTNVKLKMDNEAVKQMLCETMRQAYSAEKVYERYLWNLRNVYGKQVYGKPPSKTLEQAKVLLPFAWKMIKKVMAVGFTQPYKRLFWRYVGEAIWLRLRGKIPSALDAVFKVIPTAHHLIEWNEHFFSDYDRSVAEIVPQSNRPTRLPSLPVMRPTERNAELPN